jgi:hypothetical protein
MKTSSNRVLVACVVVLTAAVIALALGHPVFGRAEDEAKSTGGTRYTVIETQGFNLLVTDNQANKLYYYATDKDVPVGSPLKLRASLDLAQVGKEEIKITPHNLENIRKRNGKDKDQ